MDTAHKTDKDKKEHFDEPKVLEEKIDILVGMIRKSKHMTAFTGAGISTSTGIPDFRSGKDTVLPTGPGAWEKKALKLKDDPKAKSVSSLKAIPSKTHMALVQLERYGVLKYLISQNTDGLHRRSGFNPESFAELHGNTNMEKCKKCKKKYMRDFRTRTAKKVHDHLTGRKCDNPNCKGDLYDTIINFGENLPEKDMDDGFTHSQMADLQLALGSSLTVTPAADMPRHVGQNKNADLVVINLQSTPLDNVATLRINAMCDTVMEMVMKKLEIDIPDFSLQRRVKIMKNKNNLSVQGVDVDGEPYDLCRSIGINYKIKGQIQEKPIKKAPFEFKLKDLQEDQGIYLELEFMGHYNEGSKTVEIFPNQMKDGKSLTYLLEFNPKTRDWFNCEIEKI